MNGLRRRPRLYPFVRLHLTPGAPAEGLVDRGEPSMEGILVGRQQGHYVLERAAMLYQREDGIERISLEGRQHVPERSVYFLQELEQVELGGALT